MALLNIDKQVLLQCSPTPSAWKSFNFSTLTSKDIADYGDLSLAEILVNKFNFCSSPAEAANQLEAAAFLYFIRTESRQLLDIPEFSSQTNASQHGWKIGCHAYVENILKSMLAWSFINLRNFILQKVGDKSTPLYGYTIEYFLYSVYLNAFYTYKLFGRVLSSLAAQVFCSKTTGDTFLIESSPRAVYCEWEPCTTPWSIGSYPKIHWGITGYVRDPCIRSHPALGYDYRVVLSGNIDIDTICNTCVAASTIFYYQDIPLTILIQGVRLIDGYSNTEWGSVNSLRELKIKDLLLKGTDIVK